MKRTLCGVGALVMVCLILAVAVPGMSQTPQTRPATTRAFSETAQLRAIIADLQKQIAELKRANAELRSGKAAAAVTTAPAGSTTFTARKEAEIKNAGRSYRGDAKRELAMAAKIDKAISDYLAENPASEEITKALWRGTVIVGMPEEPLKYIGSLFAESETEDVKWYHFSPRQGGSDSKIAIRRGKVAAIEHDVAPKFQGVQVPTR